MEQQFDHAKFTAYVGTQFDLTDATGTTIPITLVEVSELRKRPRQESFSAIFLVPETHRVEQGLYEVKHEGLGKMHLLLVPVEMAGNQLKMEALFNFLIEE